MKKAFFMLVVFTLAFNCLLSYNAVLAKNLDPHGDTPIQNLPICDQAGYCMNETTYSWDDPITGTGWTELTDLLEPEISTGSICQYVFHIIANMFVKIAA